jgi:flagellar motility protein MotE (MotC chaperone)
MKHLPHTLLVLMLATVPAYAGQVDKEARGDLPTADRVREALGLASEALRRQQGELQEEIRRLEILRDEVRSEIRKLRALRSKLTEPIKASRKRKASERTARIRRMAKSLGAMSPAAAAVALSRMNDDVVVDMLLVMDGKRIGKILESMEPKRAAVLMEAVVERAASGQEEN